MYFIGLFGGLGERMYWEKQLSLPVKKCGAFSLYGDEGWGLILEWTLLVVFSIHLLTCFSLWEPVMIKDRTIHPLWCLKKKKQKPGDRCHPHLLPSLVSFSFGTLLSVGGEESCFVFLGSVESTPGEVCLGQAQPGLCSPWFISVALIAKPAAEWLSALPSFGTWLSSVQKMRRRHFG